MRPCGVYVDRINLEVIAARLDRSEQRGGG